MADQSDIDMDNTRAIEELTRAVQELSASLGLKTNRTETPYFIGDMTILVSYAGEWNAEKTYKVGDVVLLEENWYKCIQGNTGERPPSGKWTSYAITDGQKRLLGLFAGSNNLDIEPSGLLDNTELDKSIVKVTKSDAVGIFGNDGKPSDMFTTDLLGKKVANIKANSSAFAPEYDAASEYAVGEFVWHDGNIYQCKTAIADGGEAWNAEKWELRKLYDFFTKSNSLLMGTIAANSARLALDEDGEIIVTMNTED